MRKIGIHYHRAAAVADVGDEFQSHPCAGKSREGDRHQAIIDDLLRVSREEKRNTDVGQAEIALMRNRRALATMIVAGEHQRRAIPARPGKVRVAENIAAAVDAGAFPVPHADDSINLGLANNSVNLAAHHGGRGQVFVEAGAEMDAVLIQQFLRTAKREVISA